MESTWFAFGNEESLACMQQWKELGLHAALHFHLQVHQKAIRGSEMLILRHLQVIKANDDLTPEHHQFFLYQMLRGLKYIHTG